jgi:hypothetical protein
MWGDGILETMLAICPTVPRAACPWAQRAPACTCMSAIVPSSASHHWTARAVQAPKPAGNAA